MTNFWCNQIYYVLLQNMKKIINSIEWFFTNPKCLFFLGLIISLTATTIEVVRGRNTNYFDYQDSTRMFWEGLTPYTLEFAQAHSLYFLYLPVFCVLYAPIFLLPWWLGPYVWNIGNFVLFSLAIWMLPKPLAPHRTKIYLFLLSVLMQSIFCYQYNTVVCYIFIFAFILLEKNKPFWAVLLIMISATTKVYGLAELALLFCYPKVWRNFGYAILCGVALLMLPALNPHVDSLSALYQGTLDMINDHHSSADYIGILFARGLKPLLLPNYRIVQMGVLAILGILFFWRYKRWHDFEFRLQALAIIMGYIILFSDSPETHTYIIPLTSYVMVFWLRPQRTWLDWTLFWLLFVNFMILPTDVLCPAWLHEYIHKTFWLDVYTYFICWLRIVWWAVGPKEELKAESVKLKILLPLLMLSLPLGTMAQRRPATKFFSVKGVQFKMQFVQGGTFTMGALPHDTLADDDEVRHRVLVNNFYIGETEVTQELWEAVMPKNRSKHRGNGQWPVEYVTYDMCKDFIRRLNALTGEHFRLPTEAEWEYAARGGKKSKGYLYAGSNRIEEVAYKNMEERIPMPVAQFKPNELGLYDMSGNVWEWCEDWYRKTPTSKPSSNFHVIRGGGYDCSPRYCRSTNRYMYDQRRRRDLVGFRLALSPHFSINSFRDR